MTCSPTCPGSVFGPMACQGCEMEGDVSKIESQIGDYATHLGYMPPDDVELNSQTPHTQEEHALYAAAHCMVSERHDKFDLVNLVYAILRREREVRRLRGALSNEHRAWQCAVFGDKSETQG